MMKKLFKILMWLVVAIGIIIVIAIVFIQLGWKKTYDAPYPDIKASSDPAVIERGRYLAFGLSHCADCHVPMDKIRDVDNGLQIPLSGGWEESIPGLGTFRAPNLTPDPETGIGKLTDQQLARAIRYGVKHDGTFLAPFMLFQGMSDDDLTAVISFLRSQPSVYHKVEPMELTFIGRALSALGAFKPVGPKETPQKSIKQDSTIEYGQYLAHNIGNCNGCHIRRDGQGKQVGADFSGGGIFPPNPFSKGYAFVSPNLTPDKATGAIADWTEGHFVERFQGGRIYDGSPMPWGLFSRVDSTDLKALYKYFHSLEPVSNKVEKTVYAPGETLPE
jgi:mono/diheme cytochrome c family protein